MHESKACLCDCKTEEIYIVFRHEIEDQVLSRPAVRTALVKAAQRPRSTN